MSPSATFMDLPVELRLMVYEELYKYEEVVIFYRDGRLVLFSDTRDKALLATSRQIYEEAKPVLRDNTKLSISTKISHHRSSEISKMPAVTLQNARLASLTVCPDMYFYAIAGKANISVGEWLQPLVSAVNQALQMKRLHLTIRCECHIYLESHFDSVLSVLSSVDCKGAVTAGVNSDFKGLGPRKGPRHLIVDDFKAYLAMLQTIRGTDVTSIEFKRRLEEAGPPIEDRKDLLRVQEARLAKKKAEQRKVVKESKSPSKWNKWYELRDEVAVMTEVKRDIKEELQWLEKDLEYLERQVELHGRLLVS